MTRSRGIAGLATILTMLLLQATLVGPLSTPLDVSLPAVVVAAIAFVDGPAAGMSMGFAAGLIADLGSDHPAGVLALTWMLLGVVCGKAVDHRSVLGDALHAAVLCSLATLAVQIVLSVAHVHEADLLRSIGLAAPVAGVDLGLALLVVPLCRRALRSERLRVPNAVYTELRFRSFHG